MGREESLSRYFGGEPRVRLTISETVSGCAGSKTDGGVKGEGRGEGLWHSYCCINADLLFFISTQTLPTLVFSCQHGKDLFG